VYRETLWTAEDVLAAARDWVWIPEGARRYAADGLDIVAYPLYFSMPTQVLRSSWDGPLDEMVERARQVARGWGRDALFWWVTSDSPARLADVLVDDGAVLAEEAAILALEIGGGTPDLAVPEEVTVRRVDDERTVRDSEMIAAGAFGTDPTPEERLPGILTEVRSLWQRAAGFRSVAYLRGTPAATGGCTMAGPVARLWGAGALPEHRGKGAYRAVLDHRLKVAHNLGATLALVKGRVSTSGPILRRAGFTPYGVERCYRLPL
jgi:GNAT superfamily N-acetyltransferase